MIARTHELDPTRLCTAAVNASFETHFPEALDVMGFNYNLKEHDAYHKAHPKTALRRLGDGEHRLARAAFIRPTSCATGSALTI